MRERQRLGMVDWAVLRCIEEAGEENLATVLNTVRNDLSVPREHVDDLESIAESLRKLSRMGLIEVDRQELEAVRLGDTLEKQGGVYAWRIEEHGSACPIVALTPRGNLLMDH